ncbi:nucleolin 1 [Ipomoea triloba]|uniref:nucleolin 1 n=1 Tax=Ipomoea triloba TaxID=35885 RepID=UPI00125E57A8|nr:nucleolin 1 [Ipomoea triloba]
MVLSNKKLKEKLRAAKAELLAEQQVSGGDPNPKTEESLKTILKSVAQKPKLSKREKRREKAQSLLEISASIAGVGGESGSGSGDVKGEKEGGGSEERNKRKRKRGDNDGLESGQEVKTVEKKTKKKKKKKKKVQKKSKGEKEEGNEELKEGVKNGEEGVSQAIQASECKENADISTKVYVGGIPYYSNEDDIRSFFEGCGTITEVDCMTFPDTGKFRGIAIINFKTEAAAKRALALDGSDMGGLFLKIKPHNSSRVNKGVNKVSNFSPAVVEGYNRIYAGNLSWEITEDDLRKLFSDCHITAIRFGEDKETGEFKCYAHVDFADSPSLNTALKLDQTIVCGRPVRISCAVAKKGAVTKSRSTQSDTQAKNVIDGSKATPQSTRVDTPQITPVDTPQSNQVETPQSNQVDTAAMNALNAKIRRRTCYECGERGHLSSSCPKKQAAEQGNQAAS